MFDAPKIGHAACCLMFLALASSCTPRVVFGDDRIPIEGGAVPDLATLPPNTALDLGRYACDDLSGSGYPCQSIDNYSSFVYDRARHQMLWFGGGDHATSRDDVVAVRFRLADLEERVRADTLQRSGPLQRRSGQRRLDQHRSSDVAANVRHAGDGGEHR